MEENRRRYPELRKHAAIHRVGVLGLICLLSIGVFAQSTGRTVRHLQIAEQSSSGPPELTQAEAAIQKKDYATAEPLLQKVVTASPGNYTAWFDLGFVYNALGRTEDSIAAYRKSVAARPDVFESNLNLGLVLAKNGQPDAEKYLRAATELTPTANVKDGKARAWLSLAHVVEAKNPDDAVAAYRHAAELQPKDPEPHLSAGLLLEKENRFADALEEYKQALADDPSSADALTGMANIYMRGRQFSQAEDTLRKLVVLRPNDAGAHMQLGRMMATAGDYDQSIAELEAALRLAPNDSGVQRDLADVYAAAGKYDLAEARYRALITTNPNDADLHHSLGEVLLRQRKFPEAQQELESAVKLKPDFAQAYWDLAVAADGNKNYPLALAALEMRAKFLPESPVSYFLRATAYDHLRNYKLAAENYHQFLNVANGRYPDQEWQARHRLIAIEPKK